MFSRLGQNTAAAQAAVPGPEPASMSVRGSKPGCRALASRKAAETAAKVAGRRATR